ncbi:MAG: hypothetical protein N4A49_15075 [Marinifilaceae bacterium]|jgi:hypothetical protein|nr:hypothetical protein [Marinifilaceae bacterium]
MFTKGNVKPNQNLNNHNGVESEVNRQAYEMSLDEQKRNENLSGKSEDVGFKNFCSFRRLSLLYEIIEDKKSFAAIEYLLRLAETNEMKLLEKKILEILYSIQNKISSRTKKEINRMFCDFAKKIIPLIYKLNSISSDEIFIINNFHDNSDFEKLNNSKITETYYNVQLSNDTFSKLMKNGTLPLFNQEADNLEKIEDGLNRLNSNMSLELDKNKYEDFIINYLDYKHKGCWEIQDCFEQLALEKIEKVHPVIKPGKFDKTEYCKHLQELGLYTGNVESELYKQVKAIYGKFKNNYCYPWLTNQANRQFKLDKDKWGLPNIISNIKDLKERNNEKLKETKKTKEYYIDNLCKKIKNRKEITTDKFENCHGKIILVLNNEMNLDNLTELSLENLAYLDEIEVVDPSLFYALAQSEIEQSEEDSIIKYHLIKNYKALIESECNEIYSLPFAKNALALLIGLKNYCLDMGEKVKECWKTQRIKVLATVVFNVKIKDIKSYISHYTRLYDKNSELPRAALYNKNLYTPSYYKLESNIDTIYYLIEELEKLELNNEEKEKLNKFKDRYSAGLNYRRSTKDYILSNTVSLPLSLIRQISKDELVVGDYYPDDKPTYYINMGEFAPPEAFTLALENCKETMEKFTKRVHNQTIFAYEEEDKVFARVLSLIEENSWNGNSVNDIKHELTALKFNDLLTELVNIYNSHSTGKSYFKKYDCLKNLC